MTKQVEVTCTGAEMVDINALEHFQGNLKTLTDVQAAKIQESIIKYGFSFPVFVWKSPKGNKIIDGHQRVFVLKKMLSDGFTLKGNQVPIASIEAKSAKEAKEKVLLAASRYGRVDETGLHDFLSDAELLIEDMAAVMDLPDIYLGTADYNPTELPASGMTGDGSLEQSDYLRLIYLDEEQKAMWLRKLGFKDEGKKVYTIEDLSSL